MPAAAAAVPNPLAEACDDAFGDDGQIAHITVAMDEGVEPPPNPNEERRNDVNNVVIDLIADHFTAQRLPLVIATLASIKMAAKYTTIHGVKGSIPPRELRQCINSSFMSNGSKASHASNNV